MDFFNKKKEKERNKQYGDGSRFDIGGGAGVAIVSVFW